MPTWLLSVLPTVINIATHAASLESLFGAAVSEVKSSDDPAQKALSVFQDLVQAAPVIMAAVNANTGAGAAPA